MKHRSVVTSFIKHNDKILLMKRSNKVSTHKYKWAAISGSLEGMPLEHAYTEIFEETGLQRSDVTLLNTGKPLEINDTESDTLWKVHPFLFKLNNDIEIALDWEHTEYKWISPDEITEFDIVPLLDITYKQVEV